MSSTRIAVVGALVSALLWSISASAQAGSDKLLELESRAARAPKATHAALVTSIRQFRAPFNFRRGCARCGS
jgi:hypothetical protein